MDDLARLQIRVSSLQAEVADRRLKGLARSGGKAERATDGLTKSMQRFIGPAVLAAAAVTTLRKIVNVAREFEVLNAQLVTATGSSENAAIAFEAIQDFASTTPYDLGQVTQAFTKLVNLGLDPSEAALTSYGNTAAAMGRDLNEFVGAVANAATGEYERLKQFGIVARAQGEDISFIFRGVTTTVGRNAAEIEGFLKALGENEFAGAMQQRVNTLDGALSNLGDEWNKLFLNISKTGIGDRIEADVRGAIEVLDELNASLASGQTLGYLDALGGKFEGVGRDIAFTLDYISIKQERSLGGFVRAFNNMPENIRAAVGLAAVEIAVLVDYAQLYGEELGNVLVADFDRIVDKAKVYGRAIGVALNPFQYTRSFDLDGELQEVDEATARVTGKANKRVNDRVAVIQKARRDTIAAIIDERDAALDSFSNQITLADELRKSYDEALAARRALGEDRTAQFNVGVVQVKKESRSERKEREARERAFESLRKSLRTEEEVIQESYDNRLAIILANTVEGSKQRIELRKRLNEDGEEGGNQLNDTRETDFENLRESLRTEEEVIQESYDRRLAIILENTTEGSKQQAELKERLNEELTTQVLGNLGDPDTHSEELAQLESFYEARRELILSNTSITEEDRTLLEEELTRQRNEKLAQLEGERLSNIFQTSAQLFDGLAGLAKTFAGEQSGVYKVLFAAGKAFAIADAVIKIQQGVANAAALPFPANLGAIASVVAATGSIISTISGTQYSGAYDKGGIIPYGKIGLVGEYGPELVQGPANVRSRKETAEIFKNSQGADRTTDSNVQNNIRIVNSIDPAVMENYLGSSAGEDVIMNVIRNNPETIRAVGGAE